jgi:hypothetical protein
VGYWAECPCGENCPSTICRSHRVPPHQPHPSPGGIRPLSCQNNTRHIHTKCEIVNFPMSENTLPICTHHLRHTPGSDAPYSFLCSILTGRQLQSDRMSYIGQRATG